MRAWMLVAAAVMAPAVAMAQTPAASSAATETPAAPAPPASSAPARPVIPATGYGWSTPKATQGTRARGTRAARPKAPDALLPGFEMLPDGSTRLFVELSQPVSYDAKKGPGNLTYVLKGARVGRRNNSNPLVTVHFNTPVTSARLVPHGKDVWFVIDLRADVTPTATMDTAKEGPATLRIDFPKGAYVSTPALPPPVEPPAGSESPPPASPAPSAAPSSRPAPSQ
jgi:hypothetical protein